MVFTLVHGAFAFSAWKQIEVIGRVEGAGERNMKGMESWLAVNRWRVACSEIPAFGTAIWALVVWGGA